MQFLQEKIEIFKRKMHINEILQNFLEIWDFDGLGVGGCGFLSYKFVFSELGGYRVESSRCTCVIRCASFMYSDQLRGSGSFSWLQIFANFKIQVRNTSKISKYYIQPKYQNTAHFGEFSKIFKILVQKFCAISEVLRRFLLFFLVELEKCWKMTPWSSKSASIQPIFCYFEPKFYFDILTIFWYFGALPDWNQSPNILTWKSALRNPETFGRLIATGKEMKLSGTPPKK